MEPWVKSKEPRVMMKSTPVAAIIGAYTWLMKFRGRKENYLRNEITLLNLIEIVVRKDNRNRVVIQIGLRSRNNRIDLNRRIKNQAFPILNVRQFQAVYFSSVKVLDSRADERSRFKSAVLNRIPIDVHSICSLECQLNDFTRSIRAAHTHTKLVHSRAISVHPAHRTLHRNDAGTRTSHARIQIVVQIHIVATSTKRTRSRRNDKD